jgi:hypothetical protein
MLGGIRRKYRERAGDVRCHDRRRRVETRRGGLGFHSHSTGAAVDCWVGRRKCWAMDRRRLSAVTRGDFATKRCYKAPVIAGK